MQKYSPADILADYLAALEPVEDEGAWPIYVSRMPDTAERCICVYDTAPAIQGRLMHGETVTKPCVQIGVRAGDYRDGWAKIKWLAGVMDALEDYSTEKEDGYLYTILNATNRSGPLPIGQEPGTRRERFTINSQLTFLIQLTPLYLSELTLSYLDDLTVDDLALMRAGG